MYDFIYKRKRIVQFILALIMLPFAFFGVDYYFRSTGTGSDIARVGDANITQTDFAEALREQQEGMRQQLGANYDPALFDTPEVRYGVLDQLIDQRLLDERARKERFVVSDQQLAQYIGKIQPFQEDGKFSRTRYEQLLAGQSMTPTMFEARMRQQLRLAPMQEPLTGGNIVAKTSAERYIGLLDQQREVAAATVSADAYLKTVKIDDAAIKAQYDANGARYQTPELVKIEYVTLNPEVLSQQITVDPAEVQKQYDQNIGQYSQAEQRQASHILIAVKPDAKPEDKTAAKLKADDVAAQAHKNPQQFAELAKKYSEDSGSAPQGGDLGFFAHDGSMVKPFEDAVFAMKQPNDVTGPIETEFGWHIIKLTGVKPAQTRSFDEVKAQIEQDLRRQKATRKLAESAEHFQNLVYEQAESLEPVAKALNLKVETTPLVPRAQVQMLGNNSPKFAQAIFTPESLQAKRNTEAIDVGNNTLMAARVIEYKPATPRPFDEVKNEIRAELEHKGAADLALKAGQEKLALLQEGKDAGLAFGKPSAVGRNNAQPGFAPDALTRIFQAETAKLPAYVGTVSPNGDYSIYRITQVITPPTTDETRVASTQDRMADQVGRELLTAYLASLKTRADVKINQATLEKK